MLRAIITVLLALLAPRARAFAPRGAARHRRPRARLPGGTARFKGPVDEVLDALDAMVGVSPLSEADLKDGAPAADLERRARAREDAAPPPDALEKPSVAIFFACLGIAPLLGLLAGLANGARPFGL